MITKSICRIEAHRLSILVGEELDEQVVPRRVYRAGTFRPTPPQQVICY